MRRKETRKAVNPAPDPRGLVLSAWAVMLLVSDLPDILWSSWAGGVPHWLVWGKLVVVGAFVVLCLVWRRVRPLWQYGLVLLIFQLALRGQSWVQATARWRGLFTGPQTTFTLKYAGIYLTDLGVALAVMATLWLVKRHRAEFFLGKGDLDAPIEPVRWLGIGRGGSWWTFGIIFAVAAGVAVFFPTVLAVGFSPALLLRAVPLLPAGVLFAAVNAFTEEIYFRASFLATLPVVIGRGHAMLISLVFFGLAHFLYGSPPGLLGAAMTGFLGFLLGKAMLETRGLTWPWIIHFVPDVVVYASYAILWVSA